MSSVGPLARWPVGGLTRWPVNPFYQSEGERMLLIFRKIKDFSGNYRKEYRAIQKSESSV